MSNLNLQIENNQGANVLPFRVQAFKFSGAELDKILDQLNMVSFHLNGDWSLDWEDRNEACRSVYDAIHALRSIRKNGEGVQK